MEFSLTVDRHISTQLAQLLATHAAHPHVPVVGLVLGNSNVRHSTIAYLSACPKPKPLVGSTIEELNEAEGVFQPYTSRNDYSAKAKSPPLRDYIDEEWISSHCQQLLRCLPGGLDVIGLFILSSDRKARSDLQRPLIRGLRSTLMESDGIHKLVASSERRFSILQRCFYMVVEATEASKPTISLLDLTGSGSMLGAILSYNMQTVPWVEVTSRISLDLCDLFATPSHSSKGQEIGFEAEFYHSIIVPIGRMIAGSVAAVNGQFSDPNDLLVSIANQRSSNDHPQPQSPTNQGGKGGGKKGSKGGKSGRGGQGGHDLGYAPVIVDLYSHVFDQTVSHHAESSQHHSANGRTRVSPTSAGVDSKDCSYSKDPVGADVVSAQIPGVRPCVSIFCLRGTLLCRGWLPSKSATVGDAVYAMKLDLLRSLYARTQLHCDGMQVLDSEEEKIALHQLPRRIFSPPVGGSIDESDVHSAASESSSICFCDYLFDGDVAADAAETFIEVVGIPPERLAVSGSTEDGTRKSRILESEEIVLRGSKFSAVVDGWDESTSSIFSGGSGSVSECKPGTLLPPMGYGGGHLASASSDRTNHNSRDSSCSRAVGCGRGRRSRSGSNAGGRRSVGERLSSKVMTMAANVGLTGVDLVGERSVAMHSLRLSNRTSLLALGSVLVALVAIAVGLILMYGDGEMNIVEDLQGTSL